MALLFIPSLAYLALIIFSLAFIVIPAAKYLAPKAFWWTDWMPDMILGILQLCGTLVLALMATDVIKSRADRETYLR